MKKAPIIIAVIIIISLLILILFYKKQKAEIGLVFIAKSPPVDLAIEGMNSRLIELGLNLKIEYADAFGEPKNINTIINSFKQKDYKIVLALTTPCAQVAKQNISDKPIIFVGVTDPVGAELVPNLSKGYKNITGTMSQDPIYENVKFAKLIFPKIKRIGIIYSTSESNSTSILKNLEDSLKNSTLQLQLIKQPINQTSEIYKAAENVSHNVDIIFLINDNMVFSGSETVIASAEKVHIPVFACDIESVKKGALFTFGLNYKDEGVAAADILYELIINKKSPNEIPIFINKKYYLYVNRKIYDYNIDSTLFKSAIMIE